MPLAFERLTVYQKAVTFADARAKDLRAQDSMGGYFFSLIEYLVMADKPWAAVPRSCAAMFLSPLEERHG